MQDETRIIKVLGFGTSYIKDFTLVNPLGPEQNGCNLAEDI